MQSRIVSLWLGNVTLCHIDYNSVNMAQLYTQFYLQLIGVDHSSIHYGILGIKAVKWRKLI